MRVRILRGVNLGGDQWLHPNRGEDGGPTEVDIPRDVAAMIVHAGKAEALEPWPPKDPNWERSKQRARAAAEPETDADKPKSRRRAAK
jgi:hypothetical protein